MRVLLIEDEPTTAKAIDTMLTTEGFTQHQIVDLANDLLAMVQSDLRAPPAPAPSR